MNYSGIDVARKSCRICILDNRGEMLGKSFTLANTSEHLNDLLKRLSHLSLSPENLVCGIEATGNLWENIYSFLTKNGFKVVLLNPFQTRKYHDVMGKKAKTDAIDALVIAGLLRSGEATSSYVPDEEIQSLRDLTRLRARLLNELKDYKRRAFSLINLLFPEFLSLVKNPFGIVAIDLLKKYPTAKNFAKTRMFANTLTIANLNTKR